MIRIFHRHCYSRIMILMSVLWFSSISDEAIPAVRVAAAQEQQSQPEIADLEVRPNVIFFLVDDLGWQDTSVEFWKERTLFQDHFRTPNLEKLAKQGVRFSRAYSCAVCSPTRTSIMTGQNAARHHVTNWTLYANKDESGQTNRIGSPKDWKKEGLQPDAVTLPKILKLAGYTTIHCGKAHWGAYGTEGADPCKLGFDFNIAGHPAGAPGSYQGKDNFGNNPDGSRKEPWGVPGLEKYHGTDTHLTDALAIEASDAIETAVKESKPFFLYMAPYAVHSPIQEHPRFIENYRGKKYPGTDIDIPEVEAKYASMVEGYDAALGALMKKITELGVAENTIIVFTSDNGGLSVQARGTTPYGTGKDTHNWPLREGKGSCYEGGIRVPLVVSWARPNAQNPVQKTLPIKADSKSEMPVICEDYLPTICHWAGIEVGPSHDEVVSKLLNRNKPIAPRNTLVESVNGETINVGEIDGINITKWILGHEERTLRPLVFHYPHVWGPRGHGYVPHSVFIFGSQKLIYFYHSQRWEEYQLENDIGERHNKFFEVDEKSRQVKTLLAMTAFENLDYQAPEKDAGTANMHLSHGSSSTIYARPGLEDRADAAGWTKGGTWMDQHDDINSIPGRGKIELVFLGDSITQSWGGPGRNVGAPAKEIWDKFYSKRNAANFGISGDRTQNVLWRIENGNFDGLNSKVTVVLIGTNNLADNSASDIAVGIEQVILRLEERRDSSKILLLGILPRGESADAEFRDKISEVNQEISVLDDGRKTFYLDVKDNFVDADGRARSELYRGDFLHLSEAGYEQLATAIEATLKKLLSEKD